MTNKQVALILSVIWIAWRRITDDSGKPLDVLVLAETFYDWLLEG